LVSISLSNFISIFLCLDIASRTHLLSKPEMTSDDGDYDYEHEHEHDDDNEFGREDWAGCSLTRRIVLY